MAKLQELINQTHKAALKLKAEIADKTRKLRWMEWLNAKRRREAKPSQFAMFDSILVGVIPHNAVAVAGYVGGKWPTYHEMARRFPHAKRLSIAVTSSEEADCLDVEVGDASPADVPVWVRRQKARGVKRPCIYANRSTMPAVLEVLLRAGITRSEVRLWVADYTFVAHLDPFYDACQWTDRSGNRNLDESLCKGDFL